MIYVNIDSPKKLKYGQTRLNQGCPYFLGGYQWKNTLYIILHQLAAHEESGQAASQATFLSGVSANTKQNQGCLVTPSLVGNTKQNNFLIRGVW